MSRGDILIADDTPANRRLLSNMLSDQGYKVRAVINGQMALTAVHAAPPDLILLDIRMPGMSGLQLQQSLTKQKYALPIIFITGHGDIPMAVRAMQAGAMYFLEKFARKHPKLGEYNLGIAMIIGMACAVIYKRIVA